MKNILDVKQKDWIKVESNKKRISYPVPTNQSSYATVLTNSFETLTDENSTNEIIGNQNDLQKETLPCQNSTKYSTELDTSKNNKNSNEPRKSNVSGHPPPPPPPKNNPPAEILVIGDSMIKKKHQRR